ncbi:MAG: helix-turn-helix domain-containing protein [Oscillospiraceae bacterium]|nr:helix-turn-helix domain-containing protein [Oscillospiraceae bacterium]
MRKCQNFANNLELIRKIKDMSLYEFSQELDIPKSTLKSVIKEGNTTLETAVRIADSMNTSMDALLQDDMDPEKCDVLMRLLKNLKWFSQKSPERQKQLKYHIEKLLENICDETETCDGRTDT